MIKLNFEMKKKKKLPREITQTASATATTITIKRYSLSAENSRMNHFE